MTEIQHRATATGTPPATRGGNAFAPIDVGILAALAGMWGFSFLFIKVAVAEVSPLWVVAVRTSVGALVLLVILRLRRWWRGRDRAGRAGAALPAASLRLPRDAQSWRRLFVLATLGNAVPWGLFAWAEEVLPSGLAAVINALTPSSALLVAALVGIERLTTGRIAGLTLALVGTVVAVWSDLGAPGQGLAVGAAVLATLCYGGATVYAKRQISGTHPPLVIATGQVTFAALLSLPIAAAVGPTPDVGALPWTAVGSLVALGALGTGLAFLLFYMLIARVGATNTAMVTYLVPVVGVAAGALLLEEHVGFALIAGASLIVGGIWLAQRERAATPVEQLEQTAA